MDNAAPDFTYLDYDDLDYGTPQFSDLYDCSVTPADCIQLQTSEAGLPLLQLNDWNPNLPYDETPHHVHSLYYRVEASAEEGTINEAYRRHREESCSRPQWLLEHHPETKGRSF